MSDDERHRLLMSFETLRKSLVEANPDCLLVVTTDHMTNFFYNNNPMFCLGVSDTCSGPAAKELPRLGVQPATLKVHTRFAKGLLQHGIENDIDFAYSEEMVLDHAYMVPLSFVTPRMDLPIIPLHVGGMLPPGPTAKRSFKVGQQIREFVQNNFDGKVAVLASGSIYSDVGGPTMGSVDTTFEMEFLELAKQGKVEAFTSKVTPENLKRAGVANELLAWVTLLGILGPVKTSFADYIWAEAGLLVRLPWPCGNLCNFNSQL